MHKSLILSTATLITLGTIPAAMADTTLTLNAGWNLVSSTTPVSNVATTFGNPQKFASVWTWNSNTGQWNSFVTSSAPPQPNGFLPLHTISAGEGFWINSKTKQTVTITGSATTDTTLTLADSWNLKGVNTPVNVSEVFNANTSATNTHKYSSVWQWTGTTWSVFIAGESTPGAYARSKGFIPLTTLSPGQGFWVNVKPGQGGSIKLRRTPGNTGGTGNTGGSSTSTNGNYQLLAWNDLGMHCMDGNDYSVFSILPPYNNLVAQLVKKGNGTASRVVSGVTITYEAEPSFAGKWNTISSTKTNFWEHVGALFGVTLSPDMGLKNNAVQSTTPQPMTYNAEHDWWIAEGIPTSPQNDDGTYNHYPMVKVVARETLSGAILATTTTVLPVSDEMDCKKCHGSTSGYSAAMPASGWENDPNAEKDYKLNILKLHDEQNDISPYLNDLKQLGYDYTGSLLATAQSGTPILCAICHKSNALGTSGFSGIPPLTTAIHSLHADVLDPSNGESLNSSTNRTACYTCHPGSSTQCLRGAMGKATDAKGNTLMQCQSCHGSISAVGAATREGWLQAPSCQNCHQNGQRYTEAVTDALTGALTPVVDTRFATNANTPAAGSNLYRFSRGHGQLQCEACHGATHAIYPSLRAEDNVQSIAAQGHAGTIAECTVCHTTVPNTVTGGPHGLHTIGQQWISKHQDAADGNAKNCTACHGKDYRGSQLSKTFSARSFSIDHGTKTFAAGHQVSCYDCHNGPDGE
ncbi:MAG: hypothetical protein Q8J76_06935 [Desulfobulbaceae bacterium]|nr:hypothetical protein [Desulfobulbaceae bacterium]